METTTIHTYKALKFFKGLDKNGNEVDYSPNDIIEGVENWPTFEALKRINWITSVSVIGNISTQNKSLSVKQNNVDENPFKEFTKELESDHQKEEIELEENTEFKCSECEKSFNSKRALSVHIKRSH